MRKYQWKVKILIKPMFFQDVKQIVSTLLIIHSKLLIRSTSINSHLRTVLAGVLSDVCMRKRTVSQEQYTSAVSSVAKFAVKCSGRLGVLRYQVPIETETKYEKIYIKISFSRLNVKDGKISPWVETSAYV